MSVGALNPCRDAEMKALNSSDVRAAFSRLRYARGAGVLGLPRSVALPPLHRPTRTIASQVPP